VRIDSRKEKKKERKRKKEGERKKSTMVATFPFKKEVSRRMAPQVPSATQASSGRRKSKKREGKPPHFWGEGKKKAFTSPFVDITGTHLDGSFPLIARGKGGEFEKGGEKRGKESGLIILLDLTQSSPNTFIHVPFGKKGGGGGLLSREIAVRQGGGGEKKEKKRKGGKNYRS